MTTIGITGSAGFAAEPARAMQAGCAPFFPCHPDTLLAEIHRLLPAA